MTPSLATKPFIFSKVCKIENHVQDVVDFVVQKILKPKKNKNISNYKA